MIAIFAAAVLAAPSGAAPRERPREPPPTAAAKDSQAASARAAPACRDAAATGSRVRRRDCRPVDPRTYARDQQNLELIQEMERRRR